MIPAEAVPTSVVVGPDGAYYVGELKGFPALGGLSKVWRIEPGVRHVRCGVDPGCAVVADGFTAIVDLALGPDGTFHVVELDEAGWLAVELGGGAGGTINACSGGWSCTEEASGLPLPIAATVDRNGTVYAAILSLVPGEARVIQL